MVASNQSSDRFRIDKILGNPPRLSDDDIESILATCPGAIPTGTVAIDFIQLNETGLLKTVDWVDRREALRHALRRAMTDYLVGKTLETQLSSGRTQTRLKAIQDASERLERALGIGGTGNDEPVAPPWSISKHLLKVINRSDEPLPEDLSIVVTGTTTIDPGQARLMHTLETFNAALRALRSISQWSKSALRAAKSQSASRKIARDRTFENLLCTLKSIWTDILGQDIAMAAGRRRNIGRWAPQTDSFIDFIGFVQACLVPMGLTYSKHDISDTAGKLFRERPATSSRPSRTLDRQNTVSSRP